MHLTCIFENYSRIRNIFLAALFRLANNDNQPFVHNACKNFDFSQKKQFAKISAVNRVRE